mmetsp:Transcript_34899/g.74446  ORF Transcript_34899/g.74446 Transcript_34899/m.74446 type:complete len:432 (-) Transcript_34899:120-1415(-)
MKTIAAFSCLAAVVLPADMSNGGGATALAYSPFAPRSMTTASTRFGDARRRVALSMSYNDGLNDRGGQLGNYRGRGGRDGRGDGRSFGRGGGDRSFGRGGGDRSFGGRGGDYDDRGGGYGYDNYDYDPYYNPRPLFGNSDYYTRQGSSEDFRRSTRGDRYTRREGMRNSSGYGVRNNNGMGGGGRMQDYYTPGEREAYQQRQNQGARYGWQQQYNTERGNVRSGSSNDFRRGTALDRIQDFLTPKEREARQQRQNDGARYGWQQQYNTERGNVRSGSSSDFRRGRAYDTFRTYTTPKEMEKRQMEDNRSFGARSNNDYGGGGRGNINGMRNGGDGRFNARGGRSDNSYGGGGDSYGYGRNSGRNDGRYDGANDGRYGGGNDVYEYGRDDYYEPEIVDGGGYAREGYDGGGRRANRRRIRNSWENLRNVFKF